MYRGTSVGAAVAPIQRPHWSEAVANPVRTFHTVRHLYLSQILRRAARSLDAAPVLPLAVRDLTLRRRTAVPPADPAAGGGFDGSAFCFLNHRVVWTGADGWQGAGVDLLWTYNLHYFRYLWTLPPATAAQLIASWIDVNTKPDLLAWDPYPISLRVREWTEWLQAHADVEPRLAAAMRRSIAQQTDWLMRQLEFDLMGNHLLENAITLCWMGLSFGGARAGVWLSGGLAVLRGELERQVLDDGSHEERSPMYQALLAEALLRLSEVAGLSSTAGAEEVRTLAAGAGRRLLAALGWLVHPDGEFALLNDTALGVAPSYDRLVRRFGPWAPPPGGRAWTLPAAGYYGRRDAGGHYLVFDAGPIGPDHQPGHGHADTLTFELSHRGRRIVTDTGVLTYTVGTDRQYDRGTAAHNTVEIDGRDQSELWGAFRCARRAVVQSASGEQGQSGAMLTGSYRGPGRGVLPVRHARRIFASSRMLAFTDQVSAPGDHRLALRLHFAPGLRLRRAERAWVVEDPSRHAVASIVGDDLDWRQTTSPYHPEFGREFERASLVASLGFRHASTLRWWLLLN